MPNVTGTSLILKQALINPQEAKKIASTTFRMHSKIALLIKESFTHKFDAVKKHLQNTFQTKKITVETKSAALTFPDQTQRFAEYLDLIKKYPALGPMGNAAIGEIEIITDMAKMAEIEKTFQRRVGIVSKDKYWIWVNDAVLFPSGKPGIYARLLWVSSLEGPAGVAVLPVMPDGKIVLNRNYRHATRSWEYELPRGGTAKGEKPEQAAAREAKEETGLELDELTRLGNMPPDTGLTNTVAPIFMAQVKAEGKAAPEDSEAIAAIEAFTLDELKQGFRQGYLKRIEKGQEVRVFLRDPFLAYALFQMEIRKVTETPAVNKLHAITP